MERVSLEKEEVAESNSADDVMRVLDGENQNQ